jgi:hypothetical protein
LTITARDYAYVGLPATVAAGSTVKLVNASKDEFHEAIVFRVPDTEKRPLDALVHLPQAQLQQLIGQPAGVLVSLPGQPGFAPNGPVVLKTPGRYVVMCFVPKGANPQQYLAAAAQAHGGPVTGVPGGPPHFVLGMYGQINVT